MRKKKLKNIASYSTKRGSRKELDIKTYITTDNLLQKKAGITIANSLPTSGESFPKYNVNDILISNIRPYLQKIWFADRTGLCSSDVLVLSTHRDVNPKYLYYSLFMDDFFVYMMQGCKGTKMPRGDKKQILEFEISDSPLHTQIKIAEVLSAIDKKIAINNAINDNLQNKTTQLSPARSST